MAGPGDVEEKVEKQNGERKGESQHGPSWS